MRTAAGALFLTGVLHLAGAQAAHAQQPDSVALDTLRVDVTRMPAPLRLLPAAASVVAGTDVITARPGVGLEEALGAVPGVHIANRENLALGARITLRGFGARAAFGVRGVRLLVDDIPLTTADGQSSLNNIDLARAGRIEVLRGPASALYGNAAGGVIRIETAPPPAATRTSARVTLGNEARGAPGALVRADAGVAGPLGSGGYRIGISHLARDGVRRHSAAEQNLLNAQVVQQLGARGRLRLVLNAADLPRAENPGSLPWDSLRADREMAWPNNVRTGAGESARQVQGGVTLAHEGDDRRAQVTAWAAHRDLENPIPVAFIALERAAGGARVQLDGSRGRLSWGSGLELELQRDDRREWTNDGGEPGDEQRRDQRDGVTAIAPYVRAAGEFGRVHLTLAARWDRLSFRTTDHLRDDGDGSGDRVLAALSPSAAVLVELSSGVSAYANLTSAFQTPTTTELANAPPAPGQPCCPTGFNRTLQPERTWGGELGLRATVARSLALDAAAFAYRVEDAIVPFQVAGIEERSFFRNAGRTRHLGFELGAMWTPARPWRVRTALTAMDVRFRDDGDPASDNEDNRVPGIPPLHGFAELRWDGPVGIEIDVEHTAAYYADDANSTGARARAATVLGARMHARLPLGSGLLEPFLAVRNLTDRTYAGAVSLNAFGGRYFEPAAGRTLLLGASIGMGLD